MYSIIFNINKSLLYVERQTAGKNQFATPLPLPSRTQSLKAVFDRDVTLVKASSKTELNLQNLIKTLKTLFF
jgi:hypothetical protein